MVKEQCMNCEYCEIHETKPYTYEYICIRSKEPKEINPNDFCDDGKWNDNPEVFSNEW